MAVSVFGDGVGCSASVYVSYVVGVVGVVSVVGCDVSVVGVDFAVMCSVTVVVVTDVVDFVVVSDSVV